MDWLSTVQQLRRENVPGVLVTVVEVRGHAPRDPGTKMVVGTDRTWGSVGGGNLEETAIDRARSMIATMIDTGATAPVTWRSALNEHARTAHGRQCCGGVVTLLFEPLPIRPTVAVFGVGHVGFELARILSRLEIALHLVDSRDEQLDPLRLAEITDGAADVTVHRTPLGETVLERLPDDAQVLIMTHDHAEDYALCDAALRRIAAGHRLGLVGLIGSRAKWARFRAKLLADGHTADVVTRICSPIGLPALTGKEPVVIAVGVAAQLIERIQTRRTEPVGAPPPELVDGPRLEPVEGPEPVGTLPEPAGTRPEPAGTRPEPAGTRPEPVEGRARR
ncbi:xanthine dehydrogenase accessory factor [Friedmanniella endophytica]|uniref:Xanthine dehydrogenase accessory factor n=1 Tax=Microlunatus kandeliicorticis TaxID=1759536 RepID=A0A7W3P6B4_9ACTN|nr:xanthine dehydrogenase accessory protein XdhC [Microlunatus kandeliicorticis]MBA8794804.1 xanthine dehydrogenase accessory factor [Microlunatus kandeliicorticis]